MSKALLALLAAGVTAPIAATNGEILNKIALPDNVNWGFIAPHQTESIFTEADLRELLANPDQLVAVLQNFLASSGDQLSAFAGDVGGMWGENESFYSDPVFFGNYSSGDLRSLYAQAYPGYERTHGAYQPAPQSAEGIGLGQLQALYSQQNNSGYSRGGASFGGLGGMMNTYPGYTSQAEFNAIVFD